MSQADRIWPTFPALTRATGPRGPLRGPHRGPEISRRGDAAPGAGSGAQGFVAATVGVARWLELRRHAPELHSNGVVKRERSAITTASGEAFAASPPHSPDGALGPCAANLAEIDGAAHQLRGALAINRSKNRSAKRKDARSPTMTPRSLAPKTRSLSEAECSHSDTVRRRGDATAPASSRRSLSPRAADGRTGRAIIAKATRYLACRRDKQWSPAAPSPLFAGQVHSQMSGHRFAIHTTAIPPVARTPASAETLTANGAAARSPGEQIRCRAHSRVGSAENPAPARRSHSAPTQDIPSPAETPDTARIYAGPTLAAPPLAARPPLLPLTKGPCA